MQEQALQTIAVIAEAAKDAFERYYDTFMPLLLSIMEQVYMPVLIDGCSELPYFIDYVHHHM